MKKLFTFAAALLASVSMWAQDPDIDVSAMTEAESATYFKAYDGATLLCVGTYQLTGSNYNVKCDQTNNSAYVGITATQELKKVAFLVTGNGKNKNINAGLIGYKTVVETPNFSAADYASYVNPAVAIPAANYSDAQWVEFDLTDQELKAVYFAKQWKNVAVGEAAAASYPSGNAQSLFVYGIRVWFANSTPSTDPVESAEISGENACLIGGSVTLTCNAAKATTYQWSMNGAAIDGATAKTYVFEPTAAGSFSFTCAASNDYTAVPVVAEAFVVTVADPENVCGELIKATHTGGKTATVTGVVGGSADKNTQDNGKLGSNGHYFGVKLASGNFQAADEVTIVASVLNGGNTATIYSDKGTTLLGSADFDTESKTATFTLEAEAEWIYVYRTSSACNPNIEYIAVNRSCEASNNADIKKVWVMAGEEEMVFEPEEDGVTYNLVVPASVDMAQLSINYTLAHPKASANVASPFVIIVPAAGAAANSQVVVVTAQDGTTQKTYTFNVTKSAAASTDASLKSLAVTGFTLDPAFAADVFTYTITKAYGAENPGTDKVVCEPNDATAHPNVAAGENALIVTVTAEDGETQLVYTINIVEAAAPKDLAQVKFSNGFDAFIDNANLTVKAFYLAGTDAPTATTITAGNGTAGELADGKIIVTGADASTAEYIVTLEAVTPNTDAVAATAEAGVFDGTEAWVKNGLLVYGNAAGFNEGKYTIRRQLKSSDKADDQRVIAGWVRTYFFVGNASQFELAVSGNKPLKYAIDGGEQIENNAETLSIALGEGNHMIEIVSNQSSGDCYLSAPKLVERTATAINNTEAGVKAVKFFENGQLMIEKNGVIYNAQGAIVK